MRELFLNCKLETNVVYSMRTKPKLLTVNCHNHEGSTGKIIDDIEKYCADAFDFYRIYEYKAQADQEPNSLRLANRFQQYLCYHISRFTGYKYCVGFFHTAKAIRAIKKQKPEIVHLHCPNMGIMHMTMLMQYLKRSNIPTVITNHAEFYYTGNCPHAFDCKKYMTGCGNCDYVFDYYRNYRHDRTAYEWKLMKTAFANWTRVAVVSVSPWQMERSANSPIMEGVDQHLILNGVDENVFYPRKDRALHFVREKGYQKVILHVTANFSEDPNDLKNGRAVIELAKRFPHYAFVVVGTNRVTSELPQNVILYGWLSDQERLAMLYSDADLTLIVSKRETFGMSCAESLCCGTPVIGFRAGGPETISLHEYSEFVDYNDMDALEASLTKWAAWEGDKHHISAKAGCVYKKALMGNAYKQLYDSLLHGEEK